MILLVVVLVAANIICWGNLNTGYFERHPAIGVTVLLAAFAVGTWVEAL